jgi:hypothetical protein
MGVDDGVLIELHQIGFKDHPFAAHIQPMLEMISHHRVQIF